MAGQSERHATALALPRGDPVARLHQVRARGRPLALHDDRRAGAGQVHVERALMVQVAEHAARAGQIEVGARVVEAHRAEGAVVPDPPALRGAGDAGGPEAVNDPDVLAGEQAGQRLAQHPLVHVVERGDRGDALARVVVVVQVHRRHAPRLLGVLERLDHVPEAVEWPGPEPRVEVLVRGRGVGLPVLAHLAHQGRDPRVARPLAVPHGVAAVDVRHPEPIEDGDRLLAHPRRSGPLEEAHALARGQEALLHVADRPRGFGLDRVGHRGQIEAPRARVPVERVRVGVAARLDVR